MWYEPLGPVVVYYFVLCGSTIIEVCTVMKLKEMLTWKNYFKLFMSNIFGFTIPYAVLHGVWVYVLGLRHPMPFIGQICATISTMSKMVMTWYIFPIRLRKNENTFRKQMFTYLMIFPIYTVIVLGYSNIYALIRNIPGEFQWCLACCLPLVKLINEWVVLKVLYKATGHKALATRVVAVTGIGVRHLFALAVVLSTTLEPLTEYLLIAFAFLPNLWSCCKVIKFHREDRNSEKKEDLNILVLEELLEALVPLIYSTSFLIAYYGPNATILGGVFTDMFHFEKVFNVTDKLINNEFLLGIDVVLVIVLGVVLYRYCIVNCYKELLSLLSNHGPFICLRVGSTILIVR